MLDLNNIKYKKYTKFIKLKTKTIIIVKHLNNYSIYEQQVNIYYFKCLYFVFSVANLQTEISFSKNLKIVMNIYNVLTYYRSCIVYINKLCIIYISRLC